jgi:hypothetical protein
MKNNAFFSGPGGASSRGAAAAATIGIAAPIPKLPVSLPSKVVAYTATPSPSVSSGPTPATPASGPGTPAALGITDDLVRRVAEAKRRVADAQSKLAIKDNPYMVCFFIFWVFSPVFENPLILLGRLCLKLGRRRVPLL